MYCPNCRKPNEDSARYCGNCGLDLAKAERAEITAVNENNHKVYIVIGCLIIAIAVVVAVLVAVNYKKEKEYDDLLERGNRYFKALEYEKAEAVYLEAIAIDPKREEPYLYLSAIYVEKGELKKAIQILEYAVGETESEVIQEEIDILIKEQEKEEIERLFEEGSYSIDTRTSSYIFTNLKGAKDIFFCELYFELPETGEKEHLKFTWTDVETVIEVNKDDSKLYSFTIEPVKGKVIIHNVSGLPEDKIEINKNYGFTLANVTVAVKNYFEQYQGNELDFSENCIYPTDGIFGVGAGEMWDIVISDAETKKYIVCVSGFESDVVGQAYVYDYDSWDEAYNSVERYSIDPLETFSVYDYFDFETEPDEKTELSNILDNNPEQLVTMLNMEENIPWQFGDSGHSYVGDGLQVEWREEMVSAKLEHNSRVSLYGVKIGMTDSEVTKLLNENGYIDLGPNIDYTDIAFAKNQNGKRYAIIVYLENGIVKGWYWNNWREGEDLPDIDPYTYAEAMQ